MALRAVYSTRLFCFGRGFPEKSYSRAWSSAVRRHGSLSNLNHARTSLPPSLCGRCAAGGRLRQYYYCYSTSSSDGGGEEDGGEGEGGESEGREEEEEETVRHLHQQFALTPVSVPDIFPEVPVLPVSRNPIFPKFVKMLEVRVHQ